MGGVNIIAARSDDEARRLATTQQSVSQSLLKHKAFSTFRDQTHRSSYAESWRFASNLFMKSIVAPPSTGPSISVGGGQQNWLAFAL